MDDVMEPRSPSPVINTLQVTVSIQWVAGDRNYTWVLSGPNVVDGTIKLPAAGKTAIVFTLDTASAAAYDFLYINLDADVYATYELEGLTVNRLAQSITLIDRNSGTNDPFSLSLVARMKGNPDSGFLSSDPQVIDHPNNMSP